MRRLNWGGYGIFLLLVALCTVANKNVTDVLSGFVVFCIGAFLGLFILIAGRK